jgi:UDP-N-acetylmuramate: L-alanyl-gamma-D-glutamyl-meso-diaminopimelate ligase
MQNLSAAREACLSAGLTEDQFYNAIPTFEGTARRLQKLGESDSSVVFLDFAHAPSKVKATLQAVIDRYPGKEVIACLELHTFSSLNTAFLPNYAGSLDSAGKAFVYFNPHAVAAKKLKPVTKEEMASFFGEGRVKVFNDSEALINQLMQEKKPGRVFLLMSSGDFDGCNMQKLAEDLLD